MSQCHDPYGPYGPAVDGAVTTLDPGGGRRFHLVRGASVTPAGCHDDYVLDGAVSGLPPAHGCEVHESLLGEVRVLRVEGRLDWVSAPDLLAYLREECHDPGVVVDVAAAALDAAGIGALLAAAAGARRRHHQFIVVTGDGPEAGALLEAGFDEVAGMATTEHGALSWMRERGVDTGSASRHPCVS